MSGKVQLKAGMAGVCTILAYAKPYSFSIETSVQRKETRRPSSGSRGPVLQWLEGQSQE